MFLIIALGVTTFSFLKIRVTSTLCNKFEHMTPSCLLTVKYDL